MGRSARMILVLVAATALLASLPSAGQARTCNKYTERKVGKKCVKRSIPAIGQYYAADGSVQIAIFKRGPKQLLTVEVHIPREKLTCTPGGSAALSQGIAKLTNIKAAKAFSASGQSQYGPTTVSGRFVSGLKVKVSGSVSGLTNSASGSDTCGGAVTDKVVTLKPGIYRGR